MKQKIFTNSKELLEYMTSEAKRNEVIILDEAGTIRKGMSSLAISLEPYIEDGRIIMGELK